MGDWTFFSNYGHVLVCLARNRDARLRDVAQEVGITERAVQKIVRDLQDSGYLEVSKKGRCNRYRINRRKSLRHPLQSHCTVGKLLTLVAREGMSVEAEQPASATEAPARSMPTPPAETRPEPEPKTQPEPRPENRSVASAETQPEDTESEPAKEPERSGKRKARRSSTDTREQGSLF
jgi:hypothetical protein